ncbi:MAG: hypothetical protein QOF84_4436 [Streptomyces sp.]|jgi:hypothetical protein|nr:hypothetical protein [Streptomyces sp.]
MALAPEKSTAEPEPVDDGWPFSEDAAAGADEAPRNRGKLLVGLLVLLALGVAAVGLVVLVAPSVNAVGGCGGG